MNSVFMKSKSSGHFGHFAFLVIATTPCKGRVHYPAKQYDDKVYATEGFK